MGNLASSCVRPSSTPQVSASSPDLSSLFKASLKSRRARSSYIRSAPSSTRLMKAKNGSTDQSINQSAEPYVRTPVAKPVRKQAMDTSSTDDTVTEDFLEMNGLVVRQRPSLDRKSSIKQSTDQSIDDDDESLYVSTRCTIVPNTAIQFTAVSPLSAENVSPRTVLAFLMTSNHGKDQSTNQSIDQEKFDKILREHQLTQCIDHSTSQERDSDVETDDECEDYDGDYASYYQNTTNQSINRSIEQYHVAAQQYANPTHHYVLRQPGEQKYRPYHRNSI